TRNIPETILSSGGPITQDNTGAEFYANIFAIAESDLEEGVIWTGSDDGLIHVTKDGGKSWENVTPPSNMSPKLNMINCIDPSPFKKGKAYVAATSYKFGDYTPYLYKTEDYGKTWELITSGITENYYTRAIRSDKKRDGLLYAGTEWGMFISFDDGKSWNKFQLNLPVTSIRDIAVKENDLIVATHGRSFWMIDDLTPLHQLNDNSKSDKFILFKPDLSYRLAQSGGWRKPNTLLVGENHPNGVIINYFIKDYNEDDFVKIEILDKDGSLIRSFTNNKSKLMSSQSKPVLSNTNDIDYALSSSDIKSISPKSGGNKLIWDMRYPGFISFDGMIFYSSPNTGPKVVPGKYDVRMTYNDNEITKEFNIVKDPRVNNTPEDYEKQLDFLLKVRDEVTRANQTIIDIRNIKNDLDYLSEKVSDKPQIINLIKSFNEDLTKVENNIHMTKNQSRQDPLNYGIRINNRIAFLLADSQRGDYPPTKQSLEFFEDVKKELNAEISSFKRILNTYTAEINNMIEDNSVKFISF
ncbi:MAG: WD40/YVTN/BNR-like repeat-containing protein, partial [Cytophagales bacterium]